MKFFIHYHPLLYTKFFVVFLINGKDKSNLKEVKNLKTDEKVLGKNGYLNWNEDKKDIYYQGKTDKNLPVELTVKYYLDNKEIKNSELEGKTGHLKIVLSSKTIDMKQKI